jgi:hypothetical protein
LIFLEKHMGWTELSQLVVAAAAAKANEAWHESRWVRHSKLR